MNTAQRARFELDKAVELLNKRLPGLDFSIGYAYGGARLERRAGSVDVSPRGTKREILAYVHAMLQGIDTARQADA